MPTFKVALPHLIEKSLESLETNVKGNGIITVVAYVGIEYKGTRLPGLKIMALLFVCLVALCNVVSVSIPSFYCHNVVMDIAYLTENLED